MESSSSSANNEGISTQEHESPEVRLKRQLKSISWSSYFHVENTLRDYNRLSSGSIAVFLSTGQFTNKRLEIDAVDLPGVKHFNLSELKEITENFRQENVICRILCGRLFKGKMKTESGDVCVLVKTWDMLYPPYIELLEGHPRRIIDEIDLLSEKFVKLNPNVVKLIGFHCNERLAVVYEGGPTQILWEILPSDEFEFHDRMVLALTVGKMLKEFHAHGFMHGGIDAGFILVDETYSPKIFHFRVYCHFSDDLFASLVFKRYGYPHYLDLKGNQWSKELDVYAYGILLLELITKKMWIPNFYNWSAKPAKPSFIEPSVVVVHQSFKLAESFASTITKLVRSCLEVNGSEHPTIDTVVDTLEVFMKAFEEHLPPSKK